MGNVLLQSLGMLALIALVALAAWAAAVLSGRRRELLQELRAKRCPVCGRLGALRLDRREAVAGTTRRADAACYRDTWSCRYCGAEKVAEQGKDSRGLASYREMGPTAP